MVPPIEHILALQSIKGLGNAKMETICSLLKESRKDSMTWYETYAFLQDCIDKRFLTRLALPKLNDFEMHLSSAHELIEMSATRGIHAVSRFQESFPKNFLTTVNEDTGKPEVPFVIWYKGDLSVTSRPSLAVIGTREPTEKGEVAGEYYAEAFASIGVNIISGLAVGCDAAGHRGALKADGGVTTAILANGLDTVYPRENRHLLEDILSKGGLVISEYPMGTAVNRYNLVARDRLQAGLADATLVVQTGIHGGTMHAAKATAKAGKPLFVIEYTEYQGEKSEGNEYLKKTCNARGLRVSAGEILKDPEKYMSMLKERKEIENDMLFQ